MTSKYARDLMLGDWLMPDGAEVRSYVHNLDANMVELTVVWPGVPFYMTTTNVPANAEFLVFPSDARKIAERVMGTAH